MDYKKEIIADLLQRYDSWKKNGATDYIKFFNEQEKLLDRFLSLYPSEVVEHLTIDSYVVGKKEKTFCWWIENKLDEHGDIRPRFLTSFQKFGIDYDKKRRAYRFGGSKVKKTRFGSNSEEIFSNIRSALVELISAANCHDYNSISKNPLNGLFKNKITYLYKRDEYLPIYSDGDLNIILSLLEIPFSIGEDRIFKRSRLFDFYKSLGREDIKTIDFMRFIYSEIGFRQYLRSDTNLKLKESIDVKKYVLIDVESTLAINRSEGQNNRKGLFEESPESITSKKITGKKGEEIVKRYLLSHTKELGITGNIYCACEDNDYAHYDFSYKTNNGKTIYIEVKSTKTNRNSIVSFEMSDSEYNFMVDNANNYYIFYINNVFEGNLILRISARNVLIKPSKYKANFMIN